MNSHCPARRTPFGRLLIRNLQFESLDCKIEAEELSLSVCKVSLTFCSFSFISTKDKTATHSSSFLLAFFRAFRGYCKTSEILVSHSCFLVKSQILHESASDEEYPRFLAYAKHSFFNGHSVHRATCPNSLT